MQEYPQSAEIPYHTRGIPLLVQEFTHIVQEKPPKVQQYPPILILVYLESNKQHSPPQPKDLLAPVHQM